jgi:hypothetical protein
MRENMLAANATAAVFEQGGAIESFLNQVK